MADATPKKDNPDFGPRVTSGECRFHHVALVKPDDSKYGGGKHHITALFPKSLCDGSSKDPLKPIKDACIAQAKRAFPSIPLAQVVMPIKDGDKKAKYDGYAGHWELIAKCKPKQQPDKNTGLIRPATYDLNRTLTPGTEIYNGMYGRICVSPSSYILEKEIEAHMPDGSVQIKKVKQHGIRLQLQSVQGFGRGERFAGGGQAGDEFGSEVPTSAPAAAGAEDF